MHKKEKNIVKRRLVRSYITSVISISLVLVLLASVAVFAANASNVARYFRENMVVSVILKQSVSESEAKNFSESLSQKEYVKESRFVSKEEGAEEMKALLGEDFLSVFESSPIPVSVDIHLDGSVVSKDSLNVISTQIMESNLVEEVVWQESLVETLNANIGKISFILSIVIIILLVISFALINNTVRLNIYARRFTIHTMSLVGAKRSFICRPFVSHAVIQGAVSGLLASAIITALVMWLNKGSELFSSIVDMRLVCVVCAGTILAGITICVVSAMLVVSRVAYITKDDLYY